MRVKKEDFYKASKLHNISDETSKQVWLELESNSSSSFTISNLAYYLGAMIIISSMGWFLTEAWDMANGLAITSLGIIYFVIFTLVGRRLIKDKKLETPGGLLLTVAVSVVPLIIFGIEKYTGLWPFGNEENFTEYHIWIRSSWILMEISTIIIGLIFLRMYKFTFLTFPVAFSLWYLSMDVTPLIFGQSEFTWEQKQWVSVAFGALMLVATYFTDRRTKQDYAFWGYLFGLLAFWGGLTSMDSDSEINKLIYCFINLFLMLISVVIQRRTFVVFGAIGVFSYLGHLTYSVFEDSLLFPVVLSVIGLAIIYFGIIYHKNRERIEKKIQDSLPNALKKLNPQNREKL